MASQNQNAFMPNLEGPFSQELNPSHAQQRAEQPIQVANPGGRVPKAAAAAAIIDKFLAGVSAGRERSFMRQQQEQKQQVGLLNAKLNTILNDPTRTEADKQAASQQIYRALGQIMGGSIEQNEQAQKGKGRGKKSQDGAAQGDEKPGIGHHVVGMFKELATGMTGGHFPKELDPHTVKSIVGGALVDADTILAKAPTLEQLTEQFQTGMATAAKGVQGKPWQDAASAFDSQRALASRIDPSGKLWNQSIQDYQTRFPTGKESYLGQPDKFKTDFHAATGRDPSEAETAQAVFGMKPEPQGFSSTQKIKGSDLTFDYDANGNPRDPSRYYLQRKADNKWQPIDSPKMTVGQQAREDAFKAFREAKGLAAEADLSGAQTLEALSLYKTKIQPTDVQKLHQVNEQLKEEQLKQVREGNASIDTIADGVASGALPPDLQGLRLYGKEGERLMANIIKRHPGFNFTEARLDYLAQQTYVRSLNSQQQVRLRQATQFASESLNLIDDGKGGGFSPELSKMLDRSQYPILNKVAMTAALNGALGEDARNAALKLDIQIRDLQSELAVVYKGGNSPTDKGLAQAQEILSSNWDEKSLRQAVELSRTNLGIRLSSIKHTMPYLISETGGAGGGQARIPQGGNSLARNNVSGIRGPDGGFVEYKNPAEGYRATVTDLQAKIAGRTSTGLSGSAPLSQLVNVWTTGEDTGAGQGYSAKDVVGWLGKKGVKVAEDTPISEIPAAHLAAAIAHFETGYEAPAEEIEKADVSGRAERNSGGKNPFRKPPAAPTPPPGAGEADPVSNLVKKYGGGQ